MAIRRALVSAALAATLIAVPSTTFGILPLASSGTVSAAADSVAPLAASGKMPKTTLTICYYGGPITDEMRHLAPEWTTYTHGTINLRFVELPANTSGAVTLTYFRAHSSTCDLVDDRNEDQTAFAQYLVPLDTLMKDPTLFNAAAYDLADFPPAILNNFRDSQGHLYGLPIEASAVMIMYRKDLFAKWGIALPPPPPGAWTWSQFVSAIAKVKAKIAAAHMQGVYPFIFAGDNINNGGTMSLVGIWANGGEIFKGARPNFQDPKVLQGLEAFSNITTKMKAASPGVVGYDYDEILTSFQQGKAVIAMQWNAAAPTLSDPKLSPITAGNIGYGVFPYAASVGPKHLRIWPSVHTVAIDKYSRNQKAAFEYAVWYTSKAVASDYVVNGGGSSGRASLLTNPAIDAKRPEYSVLLESLSLYHPFPSFPSYYDFQQTVMAPEFNSIYSGQETAAQAVSKLQNEATSFLNKAGH